MMKDYQRSDENTRGKRVQNAEPNLRVVVTYWRKYSMVTEEYDHGNKMFLGDTGEENGR